MPGSVLSTRLGWARGLVSVRNSLPGAVAGFSCTPSKNQNKTHGQDGAEKKTSCIRKFKHRVSAVSVVEVNANTFNEMGFFNDTHSQLYVDDSVIKCSRALDLGKIIRDR